MASSFLFLVFFTTTCSIAPVWADEPFCVANFSLPANNDGFYPCKDPKYATVDDFSFTGFQIPPSTTDTRNTISTFVYDRQIPGLNTLGISMVLFDFAVGESVRPHFHPHSTEMFSVVRGSILISFNTSDQPDKLVFTKVVHEGDIIVIPKGLHHEVKNVGPTDAAIIGALSSQNPEVVYV